MKREERVRQRIEKAEADWDTLSKRIYALKRDLAQESDEQKRIALEEQLADLERKRSEVEEDLDRLEQELEERQKEAQLERAAPEPLGMPAPGPPSKQARPPVPEIAPERMRQYLPFKLYNELALNPGSDISKQASRHLRSLLQTVQTYCSAPILDEAQSHPGNVQGRSCEATLLFADISGFTAMSERLSARGRVGAEEITSIVNEYFTAMAEILQQNGGNLIKFGGDALLGMFLGAAQETARYAVKAALDMQRVMIRFADIDTSVGRCQLQIKIGIHTGKVFTAHVGTASQMEYWVTGEDVNLTAFAEEAALAGQFVVSAATRRHLTAWSDLKPLPSEDPARPPFYVLPMTRRDRQLPPRPTWIEDAVPRDLPELVRRLSTLTPYLPTGVLPRLVYNPRSRRVEGEHRLVAVLFVNVEGLRMCRPGQGGPSLCRLRTVGQGAGAGRARGRRTPQKLCLPGSDSPVSTGVESSRGTAGPASARSSMPPIGRGPLLAGKL